MSITGQARQTSVQSPPITTRRRPVASTAARNSASSQELTPVRSISATPDRASRMAAMVPSFTPMPTPTVESTTGIS